MDDKIVFLKVRVQGKRKQKIVSIPKDSIINEGDWVRVEKAE